MVDYSKALKEIFDLYHHRIFNVAYGITMSSADAEDIVQDVFIKLNGKLNQFQGKSALNTWLYRMTINTCIDYLRKKRRRSFREIRLLESSSKTLIDNDNGEDAFELSQNINKALRRLPPKYRTVIVLRDFEQMPYAQIAQVLKITSGTVASRLNRAHARLKKELAELGITREYFLS